VLLAAALAASAGCTTILEDPGSDASATPPPPPKPACPAAHPWAKAFTGLVPKAGAVAPDGACGAVFTAGGQTDFGTGETGEVASSALVRVDASGNTLWAHHFAHDVAMDPPFVVLDPHGDLIIAGISGSPFDLGGGEIESIGQDDVYVAKLDIQGKLLWAQRFNGPPGNHDRHSLEQIAVGPSGEVLLAGFYEVEMDFGLGPLVAPDTDAAGFVVKLDPSGKPIWQKRFAPSSVPYFNDGVGGVGVGASGEVVVAGWVRGAIDAAGTTLTAAPGTVSTFVVAYDGDGHPLWNRVFDGAGENIPMAVAVDADGGVIVEGRMTNALVVDGTKVAGGGYLFKLDGSGKAVFATSVGVYPPSGLAVDADRNILFVSDGVTKLDPEGKPIWTRGGSSTGSYWLSLRAGVAVDTGGNALVTGFATGNLDLGTVALDVGTYTQPTFAANLGP
jgi:hypothetical protein